MSILGTRSAGRRRLDAVLLGELQRCRRDRCADRLLPGLSITDDEAEELIGQIGHTFDRRMADRLHELRNRLDLSDDDIDILAIAIAPELDDRYQRIYAYLQDDVTARAPSIGLIARLLSPSSHDRSVVRRCVASDGALRSWSLIHVTAEPTSTPGRSVIADQRIVDYVCGIDAADARLHACSDLVSPRVSFADLVLASDLAERLQQSVERDMASPLAFVMHFRGPRGSGRRTAAEAVCRARGLRLLVVHGDRLATFDDAALREIARLIARETRLLPCAVYLADGDALFRPDRAASRHLLVDELAAASTPLIVGSEGPWRGRWQAERPLIEFQFAPLGYSDRLRVWTRAFEDGGAEATDLEHVANVFRLSAGRIRRAARHARVATALAGSATCSKTDLVDACRAASAANLGTFGHPVVCRRRWPDLVLPADRLEQLHEICRAVRFKSRVYDAWGFDRALAPGKGINVLFSGPPGTGKSMAAEVLGAELGLDLYRIDLSAVVSKYIGETEKNLSQVFAEAEAGNAMLFFDEADALFGKRTEVRDAHDRYANVEVSYLLTRLEQHEGIVILASNLRKNVDEAFVRRMQFTVEFPLPEYKERLALWQSIWPDPAPRAESLDLPFLAREFELSGGHIRNAALAAAFLAAEQDTAITMDHVIAAVRREYQKMGTLILEAGRWAYPAPASAAVDPRTRPCLPEQPATRPN